MRASAAASWVRQSASIAARHFWASSGEGGMASKFIPSLCPLFFFCQRTKLILIVGVALGRYYMWYFLNAFGEGYKPLHLLCFPRTLPPMSNTDGYLVLARKYRPHTFADLVGQDALVQTLTNAIKAERLHHAYVLTGIRGVGKTTTARIIAKALNCENGPSITWNEDDTQAQSIAEGRHVDVLEFDAASHTGIDDIKDLFEGVAYAPVMGRFKVYIIDEVHMLSTKAFNALLKTLEEPPAQVKFIFATTEVHKIPVTVLSRCQRFDLRRIPADTLVKLYTAILEKEQIQAEEAAIQMVARAADGSARDGLSLLDQAIALSAGEKVTENLVAEMLGLGDRSRIFDLFDAVLKGKTEEALTTFDDLYALGQDPLLVVQEMLQLAHLTTRLKVIPGLKDDSTLSELEKTRAVPLAGEIPMENLSRAYQMLLHAAQETKQADRPQEAVQMAIVRLTHLAPLPSVEALMVQAEKQVSAAVDASEVSSVMEEPPVKKPDDIEPVPEVQVSESAPPAVEKTEPASAQSSEQFNDWSAAVSAIKKTEGGFGAMVEHQVRCHDFKAGFIVMDVKPGALGEGEVINGLRRHLKTLTGQPWEIQIQSAEPEAVVETLAETKVRKRVETLEEVKQHEDVRKIMTMFPGAEVTDVN